MNELKNTITSKVTLVLFLHVLSRDHRSSDLHQSKVYLSSGLFEIVSQTNHIPLWTLKGCSEIYNDRTFESKSMKETLSLKKH